MRVGPTPRAALAALVLLGCGGTTVPQDVDEDAPLEVELRGNRIVFNHQIQFAHDSDELVGESPEILDRVAAILAEHAEIIRVQVQGHSSTDGEAEHNQELSDARALTVAEYLRGRAAGVEITSQGYGETYPLCREETPDCQERNRRVEFFVDER